MMKKTMLVFAAFAAAVLIPACSKKQEAPQVLLKRAVNSAQKADWKSALKFAEQANEKIPDDPNAVVMLALALENNDRRDEALQCIQRAASCSNHFYAQYTLGRMLFRNGKYEQCLKSLANAQALRPKDENTLILLARASAKLQTHQASVYYGKLLSMQRYQKNPVVWNELGVIQTMHHQPKKAIPFFLKAAKLAPGNPDIVLNLAILYDYQLGQSSMASKYYSDFLRIASDSPEREKERVQVSARLVSLR